MHRPRLPSFIRGQVPLFVLVGTAAAGLHWATVVLLVSHGNWPPLGANVAGWLAAFCFSFSGHHLLTFRGHGTDWRHSVARLFVVSASGFAFNESVYAVLLRWTGFGFDLLLAAVLCVTAVATYVLSRQWVFAGTKRR